jgi:hypothetical protein
MKNKKHDKNDKHNNKSIELINEYQKRINEKMLKAGAVIQQTDEARDMAYDAIVSNLEKTIVKKDDGLSKQSALKAFGDITRIADAFDTDVNDPRMKSPTMFWSKKETERALRNIGNSKPTDELILDNKVVDELGELWAFKDVPFTEFKGNLVIPSDLVMANTIPAYDEIIAMGLKDETHHFASVQNCRIIIMKNELHDLTSIEEGCSRTVGFMIMKFYGNFELILAIVVSGDTKEKLIVSWDVGYRGSLPKHGYFPEFTIQRIAKTYLAIWYGSMLAMLHPIIKEKFIDKPVGERHGREYNPDAKKRPIKTKYVRTHYLHEGDISGHKHPRGKRLNADGSSRYTRHTPYWHVSGFFRLNHKTGLRDIFVPGHWRGPDKDKILAGEVEQPEARQRELEVKPKEKKVK